MVGLSIVLEEGEGEAPVEDPCHRCRGRHLNAIANMSMLINNPVAGSSSSSTPASSTSPSPGFLPAFPVADFLDQCFLCRTKLSPGKDIYMYRGDRGFCSEECRCRQILLDEEESFRRENPNPNQKQNKNKNRSSHCSSSVHTPSSSTNSRRGSRNRASGEV
ncbi:hypothetical protein MLD38_017981 [Melastoma candidum]|uniref:Uncharacterized protein n=1 Tax=Melastoma candidum TaxID=119954 RepID=A0ACB9QSK7_9MYRT|nr:hypothetical protein MLD38_017981 [Melastoma candidum]